MKKQLFLWFGLFRERLFVGSLVFCILFAWSISPAKGSDPQKIEALFTAWKSQPESLKHYRQLKRALGKSPLRWDLAQSLLALGQKIEQIDENELLDLAHLSPLHAEYSKISLLIGKKSYQEALEKTVSLKEKLRPDSLLFACSLLRIGFLHEELGNRSGELAAWRDLEAFCEKKSSLANEAFRGLGDQVALSSYIAYRIKELQ